MLSLHAINTLLYWVAVQVMWGNSVMVDNICLRLGRMHLLMSFCGSIGTLMADSFWGFRRSIKNFVWKRISTNCSRIKTSCWGASATCFWTTYSHLYDTYLIWISADVVDRLCYQSNFNYVEVCSCWKRKWLGSPFFCLKTQWHDIKLTFGLTGCDTVASYFCVGKQTTLKVLRSEILHWI